MTTETLVDLYSPDTYADVMPHDAFARLRREQPVIWQPEHTFMRRTVLSVMVCQISPSRTPQKECLLTCRNCSTRKTWSQRIRLANPSGR